MKSIGGAIESASRKLLVAGLPSPGLDARLLMGHALGMTKEQVLARAGDPMDDEDLDRFERLVGRRLAHEPVAYIRGTKEFWSLALGVDGRVLIPRPDTEILVEACLVALAGARPGAWAADVGTGSGAIAIAIASSLPGVRVIATDSSGAALEVARGNVDRHGLAGRVLLARADLLGPVRTAGSLLKCVAANLPYVPTAEIDALDPGVRDHEPRQAIDGGEDGLDAVRRLAADAPRAIEPEGTLALEVADGQAAPVAAMLAADPAWGDVEVARDLGRLKRVVTARRSAS